MKVALIHDWLVNYGGAERVVEEILSIFPDADIYTLVYDKKKMAAHFPPEKVHTSYIQHWLYGPRLYTKFLAFMPKAFESFDLSGYDLVISSSSSCAKGVITPPDVPHIAYIHSPMRYAWDLFFDYRKRSGRLTRFFMDRWMHSLRIWDYISSQRIDAIAANSHYIGRRIQKYWSRTSQVIYPPVNTDQLAPNGKKPEDFYVAFSRFVPYKRMDLAVSACLKLNRKLVVIGSGSGEKELKALAGNSTLITFTGRISDDAVRDYLQRCRALIFCAEEDFGIIPVEAQACGRPVVAYGKGGACETILDKKTGIFFTEQTIESVVRALTEFETLETKGTFDSTAIAKHAASFSAERFRTEFKKLVDDTIQSVKPSSEESRHA